jgi:hypothetical protein
VPNQTAKTNRKRLLIGVGGAAASVLVASSAGRISPATATAQQAQSELDCTTPSSADLALQLSTTRGQTGDVVTVQAALPTLGEGGVEASPTTKVDVWWNLAEDTWWTAFTGDPVAASDGSATELASADVSTGDCAFAVDFVVPAVPVGVYPIMVLYEDEEGGASAYAPIDFEVV